MGVQYKYTNEATATTTIAAESKRTLENVKKLQDLRFESYGKFKGYLNYNNSLNYREDLKTARDNEVNKLIWSNPETNNVHIIIKPTKLYSEEELLRAQPAPEKPAEGYMATLWQMGSSMYQKSKEYLAQVGQQLTALVGPFEISAVALPAERVPLGEIEPDYKLYVYQHFPSAKERLLRVSTIPGMHYFVDRRVYGRHILDIPEKYTEDDVKAAKKRLLDEWTQKKVNYIQTQDKQGELYADLVIQLINSSANNPNGEIMKERLHIRF